MDGAFRDGAAKFTSSGRTSGKEAVMERKRVESWRWRDEGGFARAVMLAVRCGNGVEARMREEDAAIDAEDILAQAEEANALDPVG